MLAQPGKTMAQYRVSSLNIEKKISDFSCMFLNPNSFFQFDSNCSNLLDLRNLQEQVKKHSVTKNCSDLSLFEKIVLVIFCHSMSEQF